MSAPVREEESRTGTVGGGNGESGGDGETPFEREYKDYATGYASVPGLACENMGWVTEVEGEIPKGDGRDVVEKRTGDVRERWIREELSRW